MYVSFVWYTYICIFIYIFIYIRTCIYMYIYSIYTTWLKTTRSWSERERMRETHAHNRQRDWEKAREKQEELWRKVYVIPECRNKLQTQFTVRQNWTRYHTNQISHASAQGAEVHHSRVGKREKERRGGGLGERIRELEVLFASEKERERATEKESGRQKERKRERPTTARRRGREKERKRERELPRERASERGKLRSKRQRKSSRERGRDRE